MSYVLSIAIGPVQDFITASRKTRDFWMGSRMLSEMARAAASAVGAMGELVYPHPACLDSDTPVPNKILVRMGDTPPHVVCEAARNAAMMTLERFKDDALAAAHADDSTLRGLVDVYDVDSQVQDFLEFYAAWWPLTAENDYRDARLEAERLLAGRKAVREFAAASGRDGIPKATLDSSRDSVTYRAAATDHPRLGIKKGEQLDGISLIKRLAGRGTRRFVSVSRIAADPIVRCLERCRPDALTHLNELAARLEGTDLVQSLADVPTFSAFPYDTDLFFLAPLTSNDGGLGSEPAAVQQMTEGRAMKSTLAQLGPDELALVSTFQLTLRRALRNLHLGDPYPYLAVLVADGDHMGAILSNFAGVATHKRFSLALSGFAEQARRIVEDAHGALAYSGGDDVLALLPVDTVLECADGLRSAFSATLEGFLSGPCMPSLTCGVAIGHHMEPMHNLLRWAWRAEAAGKVRRDSLAVSLHVRSAGDDGLSAVNQWGCNPVGERWERWIDLYLQDALPAGAIHELAALARELQTGGVQDEEQDGGRRWQSDLLACETRRILRRKRGQHGHRPLSDGEVKMLVESAGKDPKGLLALTDELLIARHIARARFIAQGGTAPAAQKGGTE